MCRRPSSRRCTISRPRWADSTNPVSEFLGTIHGLGTSSLSNIMGQTRAFHCTSCEYSAEVSAGKMARLLLPDRKQGARASDIHDALRQRRRCHQRFTDRVRGEVVERRARLDDEHLAVFIEHVDLSVRGDG